MRYTTKSGREISFYGAGVDAKLDEFFGVLLKSWIKRDENYDFDEDPTHNQCTVTAMVVQDYFGGEILALSMPGGGTHYLNMIDGKVFDFASDQFTSQWVELDYSKAKAIPRSVVGMDGDAPERYNILLENVGKNIREISSLAHITTKLLSFRLIISLCALWWMYFGSGPWAEGRVFGSFVGFINIPWLIVCFILLLVDLAKEENKPSVLAWVLFSLVVLITPVILFLPSIISPPN